MEKWKKRLKKTFSISKSSSSSSSSSSESDSEDKAENVNEPTALEAASLQEKA